MASYMIVINVFFVAFVIAGIAGSLLWASPPSSETGYQRRSRPSGHPKQLT